jgi:predicted 3-demethylubiquinone-9 3-methyltransferase (glyoxalase superfamily)
VRLDTNSRAAISRLVRPLAASPEAEQCGWLKDRYGLSWQIVPSRMDAMLQGGTPEQVARVTKAFLAMKKFDLAELERAYAGSAATEGGQG